MAEYVCESCGMGVVGMKCAKCEKDLVHDHISKEDGIRDVERSRGLGDVYKRQSKGLRNSQLWPRYP